MESNLRVSCRAPLGWILAPIIWGYLLGRHHPSIEASMLSIVGTLCALIALCSACTENEYFHRSWAILFLFAGTFMAWGYFNSRTIKISPEWLMLPPREAELTLKLERIYKHADSFGQISGIAKVEQAPKHLSDLHGQRIYFQLRTEKASSPLIRTAIIRGRGVLTLINETSDKSDFEDYLIRSGIHYILKRGRVTGIIEKEFPFYRMCFETSHLFQSVLKAGSPPDSEYARVYIAMLLGKRIVLTQVQKERFQISGTMHFFAVSGLHVGIIAMVLNYFFLLLRFSNKTRVVIGLLLLFIYVEITGAAPSAVRAFLMVAIFWSSQLLFRQATPFAALLASGLFVLIIDPRQLWNAGFQLSYAVVAGILLYGLPLMERINNALILYPGLPSESYRWHQHLIKQCVHKLTGLFAISFSASLISSPLTIYYFNLFTPGAVLLNVILVTIATLVIINGVISLFFGLLQITAVSAFLNHGS